MSLKITPRRASLLSAVLAAPDGVTARELSVRFSLQPGTVAEHLRAIRDHGLIGPTNVGGANTRWAEASVAERLRAEAAALASTRHARYRSRKTARREQEQRCPFEDGPHRRTVAANDCQPIRPPAPASVFHMAAAA